MPISKYPRDQHSPFHAYFLMNGGDEAFQGVTEEYAQMDRCICQGHASNRILKSTYIQKAYNKTNSPHDFLYVVHGSHGDPRSDEAIIAAGEDQGGQFQVPSMSAFALVRTRVLPETWTIDLICANFRAQGQGQRLMNRIEADARANGAKYVMLGAVDSAAIGYYHRGYRYVQDNLEVPPPPGTRTDREKLCSFEGTFEQQTKDPPDGESEFVMAKCLGSYNEETKTYKVPKTSFSTGGHPQSVKVRYEEMLQRQDKERGIDCPKPGIKGKSDYRFTRATPNKPSPASAEYKQNLSPAYAFTAQSVAEERPERILTRRQQPPTFEDRLKEREQRAAMRKKLIEMSARTPKTDPSARRFFIQQQASAPGAMLPPPTVFPPAVPPLAPALQEDEDVGEVVREALQGVVDRVVEDEDARLADVPLADTTRTEIEAEIAAPPPLAPSNPSVPIPLPQPPPPPANPPPLPPPEPRRVRVPRQPRVLRQQQQQPAVVSEERQRRIQRSRERLAELEEQARVIAEVRAAAAQAGVPVPDDALEGFLQLPQGFSGPLTEDELREFGREDFFDFSEEAAAAGASAGAAAGGGGGGYTGGGKMAAKGYIGGGKTAAKRPRSPDGDDDEEEER